MDKNLTRDAGDSISANRFETMTSNVRTQFSLYLKLSRYWRFVFFNGGKVFKSILFAELCLFGRIWEHFCCSSDDGLYLVLIHVFITELLAAALQTLAWFFFANPVLMNVIIAQMKLRNILLSFLRALCCRLVVYVASYEIHTLSPSWYPSCLPQNFESVLLTLLFQHFLATIGIRISVKI